MPVVVRANNIEKYLLQFEFKAWNFPVLPKLIEIQDSNYMVEQRITFYVPLCVDYVGKLPMNIECLSST